MSNMSVFAKQPGLLAVYPDNTTGHTDPHVTHMDQNHWIALAVWRNLL